MSGSSHGRGVNGAGDGTTATPSRYPRLAMAASPGPTLQGTELRHEIERWFARRGVPQLIEGYSSESAMDRRAAPLISLWLIFGTVKDWGTRPDWPLLMNLAGIAGTIAWMGVGWAVISRLRGRSFLIRPSTFDLVDIVSIALLPAIPAAFIDGDAWEALRAFLGALSGVGLIYAIIGFGVLEIGVWAIERLWDQLTHIVELLARTLPLLLILVVFLLFAAEMWEAAHAMSWLELGFVLLLLAIVAGLLVVVTFRGELDGIEHRTDDDGVLADAAATPAAPLIETSDGDVVPTPPLTWLERSNVALLVAVPQLLQATAVGVAVMAFLVLFAIVAIPASVQEAWMGGPARVIVEFHWLAELRTLSEEMIIVSAILGGIVGLYFSGLGITDKSYRSEGFDREVDGVRRILAARALYLDAIDPLRTGDGRRTVAGDEA